MIHIEVLPGSVNASPYKKGIRRFDFVRFTGCHPVLAPADHVNDKMTFGQQLKLQRFNRTFIFDDQVVFSYQPIVSGICS